MWYDPETDATGWADSLDYAGGSGDVSCYILEYGYASDPSKPDTNGNGINDYE